MSQYSRIAWKEGMFLVPQHFQQMERGLESTLQQIVLGASVPAFGIADLELDPAGIAQGRVAIKQCRAVMPDGAVIDIPDVDPAPEARTFELSGNADALDVYLVCPSVRPRAPLMTADRTRKDIRYRVQSLEVSDDLDVNQTRSIDVALRNLRLILGGESLDGFVALKVAEIERTGAGDIALRKQFVPPLLRTKASPSLTQMLEALSGTVAGRARSLTEDLGSRGSDIEMNAEEVTSLGFLYALNLHGPVLQHLLMLPETHPVAIYQELIRLAGALSTFRLRAQEPLPVYDHEALHESFSSLIRRIEPLLEWNIRTRYERIPFVRKDLFWIAEIHDRALLEKGDLVLEVTSDLSQADLVARLPNAFKMAEEKDIEKVVRRALRGVPIAPMPRAPASMRINPDACYFRILKQGVEWERVLPTGRLAGHVPRFIKGVTVQLIAFQQGESR